VHTDGEQILAQRRAAKAETAVLDVWFHAFHQRLYPRLLDPDQGPALIERAKARVDFCEERGTCSFHDTERWRAIPSNIEARYALEILDDDASWRVALQSNSPFQFLYTEEGAPWLPVNFERTVTKLPSDARAVTTRLIMADPVSNFD